MLCNSLPQVLLLEAYEQLEADVGQEVDRALARQAEEVARLTRRVQFLEGHLDTEKKQVEVLGEEVTRLEGQLGDATARMTQYESGVYGLPQVRWGRTHLLLHCWRATLSLLAASCLCCSQ